MDLNFAYSPCPNDTFSFYGIASGRILPEGFSLKVHHHDIETLNQFALSGRYEVTKMSFHAWLQLAGRYRLLRAGNALGFGCGPVLVARRKFAPADLPGLRVVLPGEHTTANLLFRLYCPAASQRTYVAYDRIFDEILSGRADCGVIIHESRFMYGQAGLSLVCDLGEWWERTTGAPIPLGAIGVRNDIPAALDSQLEALIRRSLELVRREPAAARSYIRSMAIELDDKVIDRHISMFVNGFSPDLGEEGMLAVEKLKAMAVGAGVIS